MRPALDERTAPDPASGAVSFHPQDLQHHRGGVPELRERDIWRALAATALAALRSPAR